MRGLIATLLLGAIASSAAADIIVNSPQPITHRVTVQLIRTGLDDGSKLATAFGNETQRAAIEAAIDTVWAQAGIDIEFLPRMKVWNSTFAFQGNAGDAQRPSGDLNRIFSTAESAGLLHSDPLVLNLVMVDVVPFFKPLSELHAAGYARIGANGIAGFVGDDLLTFKNGRDTAASVMAHEIGHNLGLNHIGADLPNLMSPSGKTEQLNGSQIVSARASRFARLIPVVLEGDYNDDGAVDAADFIVWRRMAGQMGPWLAADGNGDGRVDNDDYLVWRENFDTPGGGGMTTGLSTAGASVPEPATIVIVFSALALFAGVSRQGRRVLRRDWIDCDAKSFTHDAAGGSARRWDWCGISRFDDR